MDRLENRVLLDFAFTNTNTQKSNHGRDNILPDIFNYFRGHWLTIEIRTNTHNKKPHKPLAA